MPSLELENDGRQIALVVKQATWCQIVLVGSLLSNKIIRSSGKDRRFSEQPGPAAFQPSNPSAKILRFL